MNDSSPFKRTVVFVDGYSACEVLLDDQGVFTPVVLAAPQMPAVPVVLLADAALRIGDNELTALSLTSSQ